jgi:hypothetical protein
LPNKQHDRALKGASDITKWIDLGYSPALYEGAWTTALAEYAKTFHRRYLSLALYPGLPIANGALEPGSAPTDPRVATPTAIAAEGSPYKAQFALQENGLVYAGKDNGNVYDLVQASAGKIVTGFQLAQSATKNPGKEGGPADQPPPGQSPSVTEEVDALAAALNHGLAANVDFLEVYETDAVNPAMQCERQKAESHWSAGSTPACDSFPKPSPPHCHGSACT